MHKIFIYERKACISKEERKIRSSEEAKRSDEARRLLEEVLKDPRVKDLRAVKSCQECGSCVTVCPGARFFGSDVFNPRRIVEIVFNRDAEALRDLIDESIWACAQCGSCRVVCPRGNDPFALVLAIREAGEFKVHITPPGAVLPPIHLRAMVDAGVCARPITPDPKKHPDWGPIWAKIYDNMEKIRVEIVGCPGLSKLDRAWDTSREAVSEMRKIWMITGALDNMERHYPDYIKQVKKEEGFE